MMINYIFKKLFSLFLLFLLLINVSYCYADDYDYDDNVNVEDEIKANESIETSSQDFSTLSLNARSCIVLDRLSKKVLYGKNEYNKVKMASTTKIMTAIVILENCDLNQTVEISKKAAGTGGSRLGLKTGDKITVRDLLYGLMLRSGNDAAVALAQTAGGNIEGFSNLMNAKAKELGLSHTHFESPHGLDSDEHYTTAYELALLSDYALKNSTFTQIVGTKNCTVTINGYPKNLNNTNELLGVLNGVYGIKTGFTNGANRCLVTACKRNNMDIICVVLGCDTKKFRTSDSIKLIEYTFKNFEYVNIAELIHKKFTDWQNENPNYFQIDKGLHSDLQIRYTNLETPMIPIPKNDISSIKVALHIKPSIEAPIYENTVLGGIEVTSQNNLIAHCDIVTNNAVPRKYFFNYFVQFFMNYSHILNETIDFIS